MAALLRGAPTPDDILKAGPAHHLRVCMGRERARTSSAATKAIMAERQRQQSSTVRAGGLRGPRASQPRLQSPGSEPGYESRPSIDQRVRRMVGRALKRRAQAALRWGLGRVGAALRDWREPLPPLRAGDPGIRRILVVRVDLLGDVVLSTPAVRALRRAYPRAQIDMLRRASRAPTRRSASPPRARRRSCRS